MLEGSANSFDATPRGLLRLLYGIVLGTVAGILLLHMALGLMGSEPGPAGWFLLALDGVVLVVAYLGYTLEQGDSSTDTRPPLAFLPLLLGQLLVVLCFETGGVASPYFLLVLTTCVFVALTLPPPTAMLLVAVVGATYAFCAWIAPAEGLMRGGLRAVETAIRAGRQMGVAELSAVIVHCAFLFVGSYTASRLSNRYRQSVKGLEESATRDPLTTLLNRRGFLSTMRGEIGRAERYAWPIAILMIDLDHFKRVNDEHGHAFGDAVLKTSGRLLREAVGTIDHLARVGGEEFSVAAVAADPNHGAELAQRILRHFRSHAWDALKPGLKVTCSIGVAILYPGKHATDPEMTLSRLMDEADRSLYQVKQGGRNDFLVSSDSKTRAVPSGRPA